MIRGELWQLADWGRAVAISSKVVKNREVTQNRMFLIRCTLPIVCLAALLTAAAQPAATPVDPQPLVVKVIEAAGGADKLLRLFRMKERYHFGALPEPASGKSSTRDSVLEAPAYWWVGKKDRTDEPAKFDVWAWTLVALTDDRSKIEVVPDVTEDGRSVFGLRVSGTIDPPLELYFDRERLQLVRTDWRSDIYRFTEWKEHDGAKYPAQTIIYKKVGGKPWFYHEITEIERLRELPVGLSRDAPAK